ncbi:hypothetical protein [Streptomyces sp. NPDC058240]|uniref:hypothetical protein n=1 Tax=Streptomyces sp. NPDC058240 TaxID=3346396 RepID=UPI0036EBE887
MALGAPQVPSESRWALRIRAASRSSAACRAARAGRCTYSRAWISVKANYQLTANAAEAEALSRMLDTCDA